MKVDDPVAAIEAIERQTDERPALYDAIPRVAPAMRTFEFQSMESSRTLQGPPSWNGFPI
jgi:hypothetical protein